jgi:hypothetical protein
MPEVMDPAPDRRTMPTAAPYRIDVRLHDVLMESSPGNGHPVSPAPRRAEGTETALPLPSIRRGRTRTTTAVAVQYQRMNARRT